MNTENFYQNRAPALEKLLDVSRRLLGCPNGELGKEVERRIEILRNREKSVSECLLVVVLGGTKVGKTTLINALAGKPIGEPSAKACFTTRPAVYAHSNSEITARARLTGVLKAGDRMEIHRESCLERIVLIDTPDLDGVEEKHRDIFNEVLERADLALCILTTQKYDSSALFEILGQKMGFRRTVFVFNRIDEGIPFSEKIRLDLVAKVAPLNLKPPEGEMLPIFSISAQNAFLLKQGTAHGPAGEFRLLEEFLHTQLNHNLYKRISMENLVAMCAETEDYVRKACRIDAALVMGKALIEKGEGIIKSVREQLATRIDNEMRCFANGIRQRREASAAEGLGGPFGFYIKATLAVSAFSMHLNDLFSPSASDFADRLSARLTQEADVVCQNALNGFERHLIEEADRFGVNPASLLDRFRVNKHDPVALRNQVAQNLRDFLFEPKTSSLESFLLNILPAVVILFIFRYFLTALVSSLDPSAGMFLGGAFLLLLICYFQASFWLGVKVRSLSSVKTSFQDPIISDLEKRMLIPLKAWEGEVESMMTLYEGLQNADSSLLDVDSRNQ